MKTTLTISILALMLGGSALAHEIEPPEWEPVGGADTDPTGLIWNQRIGYLLFVATTSGYLTYRPHDGSWTSFEEPGVPGREVTDIVHLPRVHDGRRLVGRLGADGHGVLELNWPAEDLAIVTHTSRAGAVSRLAETGWYDKLGLACTRALGAVPGEMLASADSGATWIEWTGHGHHDLMDIQARWLDDIFVAGDAGIMHTSDGGVTWQARNDGLPSGTVRQLVEERSLIYVGDKSDRATNYLLALMDDGVYRTELPQVAWQRVLAEPSPRQALIVWPPHPWLAIDVYVVTADGRLLHAKLDQWEWIDLTGSLAGETILSVQHGPQSYRGVHVLTAEAGVFYGELYPSGLSVDFPAPPATVRLEAAPNPFNPTTVLSFSAPAAAQARLTVHDARGRLVATLLADEPVQSGPVATTWQPRNLASGSYIARLLLDGEVVATRRVMLVK
jgi:hypothetical protein